MRVDILRDIVKVREFREIIGREVNGLGGVFLGLGQKILKKKKHKPPPMALIIIGGFAKKLKQPL